MLREPCPPAARSRRTLRAARRFAAVMLLGALGACSSLHALTRQQDAHLAQVPPGVYRLDPRHCSVTFDVDHLGFSRFVMRFDHVGARLDWPATGAGSARLQAWVASASIDTNDALLDRELRGPAMLDARHHARITLRADGLHDLRGDRGLVHGELRLGRTVEPIVLHVRFHGYGIDPINGLPTLGFSARASFSRARLGLLAWPGVVGDSVHLRIEAEFVGSPRPAGGTTSP